MLYNSNLQLDRKEAQHITAPLPNAGEQQSICKSGRFAGTIIFALQMATNIVSLSVIFR